MISYLKKLKNKFYYALAGICYAANNDHSIRLQMILGAIVIAVSLFLNLSSKEWCIVLAMIVLVIAAECFNSAVERIVDVLYPQYNETAKIIKDLCAAAVLFVSLCAAIFGIYILGGHLWEIIMKL